MKKMMILFVASMSLMAVGCKKHGGAAEGIAKMAEYKDKMCACKDTACATKVSDEMAKWSADQGKDQKDHPAMSEEETKKATQIGEEMGKCMQKAMGAATMGGAGGDMSGGSAAPAAG